MSDNPTFLNRDRYEQFAERKIYDEILGAL